MHKPKKTKCGIKGLVFAGLIFACVGLSMIIQPVSYVSPGGMGKSGPIPISVFDGNDSAFIGLIILFMGSFILVVSYKIKNP